MHLHLLLMKHIWQFWWKWRIKVWAISNRSSTVYIHYLLKLLLFGDWVKECFVQKYFVFLQYQIQSLQGKPLQQKCIETEDLIKRTSTKVWIYVFVWILLGYLLNGYGLFLVYCFILDRKTRFGAEEYKLWELRGMMVAIANKLI